MGFRDVGWLVLGVRGRGCEVWSRGPRDDLRKGGFRGGLFFVFLFLSCLFQHQGCGVGGWGNFLASSRSFFFAMLLFLSSACSCGLKDDWRYGDGGKGDAGEKGVVDLLLGC